MSNIVLARLGENIKASVAGQVTTSSGPTTAPALVDNTFSFRNKIINGNFDFWQRGTSFSTPAHLSYVADRWQFLKFTGNASNVARGTFTVGQTDVPNSPQSYIRITVSTAGDVALGQKVEGVETLAGKTATYSFWIRAQSNTTLNQVVFEQMFGTGGGGSGAVNFNGSVNAPVTTNWTKITGTVNVPNINGKTKGANIDNYLAIRIDINESYVGWFDIAQVQLEEGSFATAFEQRPIGTELALCQRYYEKSYAINVVPGTTTTNGGYINAILKRFNLVGGSGEYQEFVYKTKKRTNSPVVKFYSPMTGAVDRVRDDSNSADRTIRDILYSGDNGVVVNFLVSSIGSGFSFQWTADAEL